MGPESPAGLVNTQMAGPRLGVSRSAGLGFDSGICISSMFPDVDTIDPGTIL